MYELVSKAVELHNLDWKNIYDICEALCVADVLEGSNRRELSLAKFFVGDNGDWSKILDSMGVEQDTGDALPEVQKYRLITDALIIASKENYDLCSERSYRVLNIVTGGSKSGNGYKDKDYCLGVLENLAGEVEEEYSQIKKLVNYVHKCHAENEAREAWSDMVFPYQDDLFTNVGEMSSDTEEHFVTAMGDKLISYVSGQVYAVVGRKLQTDNPAKVNLLLIRLSRKDYTFGSCCFKNNAPSVGIVCSYPTHIRTRLGNLFRKSVEYDINDLENILMVHDYLEALDIDREVEAYKRK